MSSAFLIVPSFAFADTVETVVVTATRTPQPLQVTGTSLSIITEDDLRLQQIDVLTDALKEIPGVMVNRTGGIGQTTTVSLRGAEQGQTVALIDGVRINDPSDVSEGAVFGDVMVNGISRVEILRGPQSTLYGSDAIGGVVNIITKRGGDTPFALTASAEGGSFDTYHLNAAANGTDGDFEYGAAVNYFDDAGVSMADSRNGNPESDGTRNFGAALNTRFQVNDRVSVDLHGYYSHAHTEFDDNFLFVPPFTIADSGASNTNELLAGYAGVNADFFGGAFHNRIAAITTSGSRQYFDSATDPLTHLNYQYFANAVRFEYQGIVDINADNQLTFGAETQVSSFRNDNFGLFAFFSPPLVGGRDRLTGYYAQVQSTFFDQLTLTGGARYDDDQTFGAHTSVKLAAAWQVPNWDATLRANYGNGFKAPSLFQEFGPNNTPFPTPLKPETSRGWEVGFDKTLWDGRVRGSVTYFARNTSDQIGFQNCFTPADAPGCPTRVAVFGYYLNLDKTRTTGVEMEAKAEVSDTLDLSLDYTNMSAVNLLTATQLARRPHDLASGTVTWRPLQALSVGASVTYVGKRFDDNGNFTPMASNTTANLFGAYDLSEQWQVFGRVENVFNDRTEQVSGYGVPGIGAFAGVRTTF